VLVALITPTVATLYSVQSLLRLEVQAEGRVSQVLLVVQVAVALAVVAQTAVAQERQDKVSLVHQVREVLHSTAVVVVAHQKQETQMQLVQVAMAQHLP
jgi:hypothetical protein